MSDNFHFDLTGVPLDKSMDIAFLGAPGKKAVGWAEVPVPDASPKGPSAVWGANNAKKRLILFWSNSGKDITPFPSPQDAESMIQVVKHWLETADYGPEPRQDGDNSKGSRVYNETWGHVAGDPYAFVAIEPVWLMYGK